MSARYGEWHLLGYDGDPIPADPWEVEQEATHYTGVADRISAQIDRLNRLTHPDSRLEGHYADALESDCADLADHLGKIEGRFRSTGSALRDYTDDVETARTKTKNALDDAEEIQRQEARNSDEEGDGSGGGRGPFDDPYAGPKSAATTAMNEFDGHAEDIARRIRDASDDDMKDSTWDRFKDLVSKVAGVLDAIADILGWIATALVVLSLFIPGLNVLVLAAILLVGALLIHTLLAATGNGSWLDVAFDIVGIATLGIGTTAMSAARVGRAATLATGARIAGPRASARFLAQASFNGGRGLLGGAHRFLLRTFSPTVRAGMRNAADDAARAWTSRALPSTSIREALRAGGDHSLAALAKDHRLLVRELGEHLVDPRYTQNLQRALTAVRTGAIADLIPKIAQPKIGEWDAWELPPYGDLSDALTIVVGGPF